MKKLAVAVPLLVLVGFTPSDITGQDTGLALKNPSG
jgi:hypothetical protein